MEYREGGTCRFYLEFVQVTLSQLIFLRGIFLDRLIISRDLTFNTFLHGYLVLTLKSNFGGVPFDRLWFFNV